MAKNNFVIYKEANEAFPFNLQKVFWMDMTIPTYAVNKQNVNGDEANTSPSRKTTW